MNLDRHLILQSVVLRPSDEWTPPPRGWVVVRVGEGVGYWLQGVNVRELTEGSGFVASGVRKATVRASQMGNLKLELYSIQTTLLEGFLTVSECSLLEQAASSPLGQVIFFTAAELLGQKFSRLAHQPQPESLSSRAALLHLWSQAVTSLLTPSLVEEGGNHLRHRFRHLVAQMPDAELIRQSVRQLAGQLQCSQRHFSRLFREEFGISLRARQTELRLQRARQLLADSNDKISNVAFESGYLHLGLFNAMFKKRFGLRPKDWRQQNRPLPPQNISAHADTLLTQARRYPQRDKTGEHVVAEKSITDRIK